MKWLIVTADDFGLSRGVNRGITEAHRNGILTSTSLMVDGPAADEAATLGRGYPTLSVGLHLQLDGVEPEHIPAELDRQLERFQELCGFRPTHADSHHDVHRRPEVLPHVLSWAGAAGLWVRGYSAVRHLSKFYGRWGGETHAEQIDVDGLIRLLEGEVRDGVTELNCHPGYVEPDLASEYAVERELELRTLCDRRTRRAIRDRAIHLIGFRDLPELTNVTTPPDPER